jgi:hypothetical protein
VCSRSRCRCRKAFASARIGDGRRRGARAARFLADAIRQASPGAPTGLIWAPNTCTQAAIEVYNNSGVGLAVGTDKLDVIYASMRS